MNSAKPWVLAEADQFVAEIRGMTDAELLGLIGSALATISKADDVVAQARCSQHKVVAVVALLNDLPSLGMLAHLGLLATEALAERHQIEPSFSKLEDIARSINRIREKARRG